MALSRIASYDVWSRNCKYLLRTALLKPKQHRNYHSFRRNRPEQPQESIKNPFAPAYADKSKLTVGSLWRPLCFTVGFSATCFVGAAIWESEKLLPYYIEKFKEPVDLGKVPESDARSRSVYEYAINKTKKLWNSLNETKKLWNTLNETKKLWNSLNETKKLWNSLNETKKLWNSLSEGERVFVPICALNLLVWGAWKIPRLHPFMLKYFCSSPGQKSVLPMLFSTFSHYSAIHLCFNMHSLYSFSIVGVYNMWEAQFLALYLSGGVASSFASYAYKVFMKYPKPSLGASGAIMAIIGCICTEYPDAEAHTILLPGVTFSAATALKVVIGIDVVGVLRGWKYIDHAAHLTGGVCGILWTLWVKEELWPKILPILQYWHKLRESWK